MQPKLDEGKDMLPEVTTGAMINRGNAFDRKRLLEYKPTRSPTIVWTLIPMEQWFHFLL